MKLYFSIIAIALTSFVMGQQPTEDLPYRSIPEPPESYTPGTVVSRMIDGLGFRYYWATEGLTDSDFGYKPTDESRSIGDTMHHIYNLTRTIVNSAKKQPTDFTKEQEELTTVEKRRQTLENLKIASQLFKETQDLGEHTIIFKRPNGQAEFPFWNHLNGPIEDAVWHTGQIVMMRRSAGNPFNSKVSVFTGTVRD